MAEPTSGPHRIGGRYEIGELLGRGGMADVRKGTDIRLGRTVAIKRLRTDLASDAVFQARFRREAQSAASLNHPSIVSVYDTGEELADDAGSGQPVAQPYIVMEYVAGRTLRDILREGRKILPERALEITSGTLAALDYSHRAGIIHRDIKPANVMLTPAGDVKVMDFGIARAVADAQNTMTQTAAVVGTAQYLSPEQARGETVDSRSDVYSTGCLLYELLTGRPPFVGDSPVAVAYQHVREQAQPPSTFDADLTSEIDAIVMKALAKRVEDRYQSAAAMKEDIDRYLAGRPVQAPAVAAVPMPPLVPQLDPAATSVVPTTTTWTEEPERRRIAPYVLIGLIVLALLIGGGLMLRDLNKDGPNDVSLPSVTGLTLEAARTAITGAGLVVGEPVAEEFSDTVKAGTVISQDPSTATDSFVAPGSTVNLVVSKGKEPPVKATIPTGLIGSNKDDVAQQLKALKFEVKLVSAKQTTDEELDEVTKLSVKEGAEYAIGTKITVTYSQGPPTVPDVEGRTLEQARQLLKDAGFTNVTERDDPGSPTQPAGTIVYQTLPAGTKQNVNTPFTIGVSTYTDPVPPTESPTTDPTLLP
ncbi:MAG: Stk1 family PASTA domain-containing Ser/Thr kinase [Propionibacteriales bacterium]|nr:Stk1 family PASTA domain-containing Ser/Thr kinase [Propionibacteriales bacterium]